MRISLWSSLCFSSLAYQTSSRTAPTPLLSLAPRDSPLSLLSFPLLLHHRGAWWVGNRLLSFPRDVLIILNSGPRASNLRRSLTKPRKLSLVCMRGVESIRARAREHTRKMKSTNRYFETSPFGCSVTRRCLLSSCVSHLRGVARNCCWPYYYLSTVSLSPALRL